MLNYKWIIAGFTFLIGVGFTLATSAAEYVSYCFEDAYVAEANPTANFGSLTWVEADDSPGYRRMGFFKFDLPEIPADEVITSIQFNCWVYGGADNPNIDTHYIFLCSDNSWDELGITWNNAPFAAVSSVPAGKLRPTKLGWVAFEVTDALRKFYDSGTVTLVLRQTNGGGHPYTPWYTREVEWAIPYLTVVTEKKTNLSRFQLQAEEQGVQTGGIISGTVTAE